MHILEKLLGRHAAAVVTLAMGTIISGSSSACDPIIVLSNDAKFVALESDSLAVLDVGNLWWLGIRDIESVVPGSRFSRAAFWSQSRDREIVDPSDSGLHGSTVLTVVTSMDGKSTMDSVTAVRSDGRDAKVWWVSTADTNDAGRLVTFRSHAGQNTLEIADETLTDLDIFETRNPSAGFGVACTDSRDNVLVAGLRNTYRIGKDGLTVSPIPMTGTDEGFRLTDVSTNCLSLLARFEPLGDPEHAANASVDIALVDLDKGSVLSTFSMPRFTRRVLFRNGSRLLRQDLDVEIADGGAVRLLPTQQIRLLDTASGDVIASSELPVAGAIEGPFCAADEAGNFILRDGQDIYLVSGNDLSVIEKKKVPFAKFFVY